MISINAAKNFPVINKNIKITVINTLNSIDKSDTIISII